MVYADTVYSATPLFMVFADTVYSVTPLLIVAYSGIGHRVGACHTASKTTSRILLRGPCSQMDPAAEGEGCDDRARWNHGYPTGGGGNM